MMKRLAGLLCSLFILSQHSVLAAENNFKVIFALRSESAARVMPIYNRLANGQTAVEEVQLPFRIALHQSAYQVEKTYPVEVFREPRLKAKFEQRLGGRLFVAKVRILAPYKQEAAYQALAQELARPEVIFASPAGLVSIPDNETVEPLKTKTAASGTVAPLLPKAQETLLDPLYAQSYHLQFIQAELAWRKVLGNRALITAVVDTGTKLSHEDLEGNGFINTDEIPNNGLDDDHNGVIDDYNTGFSVTDGKIDNDGKDVNGHGTAVASIQGARKNGIGMIGVAPECRILSVRFLNAYGLGTVDDGFVALGLAIETIAAKGPATPLKGWINNSWGSRYHPDFAATFKVIFGLAYEEGIGISSAAGNFFQNNDQALFLPSSVDAPNNIAVGASDDEDNITDFSHIGPKTVHLAAPGYRITIAMASLPNYPGTYGKGSGTSFAAPQVAGAAILISGAFPQASVDEVVARIIFNVDRKPEFYKAFVVSGRLNVYNALVEDDTPPSDISWASPLTAYHNQVSFAWFNGQDDFNDPRSGPASAVRLEVYSADEQLVVNRLVAVEHDGFQKENLTGLQESTRYFPVIYNIDRVGHTSRPLRLTSFVTPPAQILLAEDFEKGNWQRLPDNSANLWHITAERFTLSSKENATKAYRFGRPHFSDYAIGDASQTPEGHILSPPINIKGYSGLELELDWFISGDFAFDTLYVFARTELEQHNLASTFSTINEAHAIAWQKLKVDLPEFHTDTMRLDVFFSSYNTRFGYKTEGAYLDRIKVRGSRPVVIFPDPTQP